MLNAKQFICDIDLARKGGLCEIHEETEKLQANKIYGKRFSL